MVIYENLPVLRIYYLHTTVCPHGSEAENFEQFDNWVDAFVITYGPLITGYLYYKKSAFHSSKAK